MPTYTLTLGALQVRQHLQEGLEAILRPEAIAGAELHLQRVREGAPASEWEANYLEQSIRNLESVLASGGRMSWSRFDVTDAEGVTRSQRLQSDSSSLWQPSLDGATELDLLLEAGYPGDPCYVKVRVYVRTAYSAITIEADDERLGDLRMQIGALMDEFVKQNAVPAPPTFKVFVGHGGDPQWKYLHRALNDIHGILAEAFESSERAGFHTLSVVDQMVRSSAVAVVVMTGELEDADGTLRARENVVHEVGFCQGALGIANTIVVLEEGVSEPSNIAGLTQVRFAKGRLIDVESRIVDVLRQRQQVHSFQQG